MIVEKIRSRRSITVTLSKVKARSIVDAMTVWGIRSVSIDIEKALRKDDREGAKSTE